MDISILAVGRLKTGPERDLCARYLDRARKVGKALGFRGFAVQDIPESRAARPAERIAQEEAAILTNLAKAGRAICLDPRGELIDSESFADLLRRGFGATARVSFVIGGADGLGQGILATAERRLAFGRQTWPHQIVRIMLAEQLYRAMTILSGHPYHRA
jgi:23S rRNA (pseudouridine1915-N3)-methyltransferase